jgi:hypothetical protein
MGAVIAVAWAVAVAGCASAPVTKASPRPPTDEDRRTVAKALGPVMITAGLWRGAEDGCAVALSVLPVDTINVSVGRHPTCKIALVVTEGALKTLTPEEMQAAMAHEVAHVQLGHFAAREERRRAEREGKKKIDDTAATTGAILTAIPIVGPLLAIGVMGTHAAAEVAAEDRYRTYDRGEETAADRFAAALLRRVPPAPGRCQALVELLERLDRSRSSARWTDWLSTHPTPASRVEVVKKECQAS